MQCAQPLAWSLNWPALIYNHNNYVGQTIKILIKVANDEILIMAQ
jgi:hypothetical protein